MKKLYFYALSFLLSMHVSCDDANTNSSESQKDSANDTKEVIQNIADNMDSNNTPEELGQTLLSAIKQNDEAKWTKYIHPESPNKKEFVTRFSRIREKLMQENFKDWETMKYKSSKLSKDGNGQYLEIQFTYGANKKTGKIGLDVIAPKDGKYYMYEQTLCYMCEVFLDV